MTEVADGKKQRKFAAGFGGVDLFNDFRPPSLFEGRFGLDGDEDKDEGGPVRSSPLYMTEEAATEETLVTGWHVSHAEIVADKTGNKVFSITGYGDAMRAAVDAAINTENIRRLVAGKGERFLKKHPETPDRRYALRMEVVTRNLFRRLQDGTKNYTAAKATAQTIGGITSVADMVRMLFGDLIWKVCHASTQADGVRIVPIRVTKRVCDLSPFVAPLGPAHVFTEEEMRFIAYACAVLAYSSGFSIYSYEERRIERLQSAPEDIILEISWVY